jgi:acyl-coenzyme A thioesterase PaaI-like protein
MNLGEVASGLAFMTGLPKGMRAILTGFEVEFLKKARGTLESECRAPRVTSTESQDYVVEANITDASKTVVCRVRAKWRAGSNK